MYLLRRNGALIALALTLALVLTNPGWSQAPASPAPGQANQYREAVALLDQAEAQLTAQNLPGALALVKKSNELFTRLQQEGTALLAERPVSPQDDQQLAINQKLAADTQAEADKLLAAAAAKKKQAEDLEAQGKTEAGNAAYAESREGYRQAQKLSIKSAIYALRNQQIIFRFLAP
jgi:hypothetical protein